MATARGRLFGLTIDSEIPLDASSRDIDASGSNDLVVRIGPGLTDPDAEIQGELLLDLELDGVRYHTGVRRSDGSVSLRFWGVCDFVIDPELRDVEVRMVPGVDPALPGVLLHGALPAFVLLLRGEGVLHASAVHVGGQHVAFVGRAGMGKSTLAAIVCQRGGRLLTDDVLRFDVSGTRALGYAGTREIRLRPSAEAVANQYPGSQRRHTCDGRVAVRPSSAHVDVAPLDAILVPRLRRDVPSVRIHRLSGAEAMLSLLRFPRFPGLIDAALHARQLDLVSRLARKVPVLLADVPWGQPPASDVAAQLLTWLGLGNSVPTAIPQG